MINRGLSVDMGATAVAVFSFGPFKKGDVVLDVRLIGTVDGRGDCTIQLGMFDRPPTTDAEFQLCTEFMTAGTCNLPGDIAGVLYPFQGVFPVSVVIEKQRWVGVRLATSALGAIYGSLFVKFRPETGGQEEGWKPQSK